MTLQKAIDVLSTERECVSRDCDRDCGKCDLVMKTEDILAAYDYILNLLKYINKELNKYE